MVCAGCQHSDYCFYMGQCALGTPVSAFPCDAQQAPAGAERNAHPAGAARGAEAPVSQNFEVAA